MDFRQVARSKPVEPQRLPRPFGVVASLTAFVQGFCAFTAQIAWTRVFAQMFGSSVYTFSLMLAVLLFSLAAASLTVHFWRKKGIAQIPTAGRMQILFGVAILAVLPLWEWQIYFFAKYFSVIKTSWLFYLATQALMAVIAIAPPCFYMGLVLPSIFEGRVSAKQGSWAGTIYAWNTFGAVLGASVGALFLLLRFGVFTSLKITAAISIIAGLVWILFFSRSGKTIIRAAIILPAVFAAFLYPLNKPLFAAGVFYYGEMYEPAAKLGKNILEKILTDKNLVFYKDGMSSTISVIKTVLAPSGKKFTNFALRVNGKTDASILDVQTQLGLAFLPLAARPEAERALVVGLGSGMTLAGLLTSERIQQIDCVEIEPAVIEAQRFFVEANNNALADPRGAFQ
jgi:spermidine synthase